MASLTFSASSAVTGARVAPKMTLARSPARVAAPVQITAKQTLEGKVVSVGLEKSAVMQVARKVPHPRYLKLINKTKKFTFHDEDNSCQVGMVVQIEACRPMSKSKMFTLKKICSEAGCAAE